MIVSCQPSPSQISFDNVSAGRANYKYATHQRNPLDRSWHECSIRMYSKPCVDIEAVVLNGAVNTRYGNVLDQQQNRNLRLLFAEEDAQNTALTLKVVKLFFCTAVI